MCFPQLLGHATSSATADEGFAFLTSSLTTLLSCRFRSGNPYRCNVFLSFWIIFSQWSMMSPRRFSCACWLFVYLLQGNAYSSLSPIVIEVVNDCVDPSHGCLVSTHSVLCWASFKTWCCPIYFFFCGWCKKKKNKKITKFTVKVSLYTFSKMLVVLFLELTSLLYFWWNVCWCYKVRVSNNFLACVHWFSQPHKWKDPFCL